MHDSNQEATLFTADERLVRRLADWTLVRFLGDVEDSG